ncbi:hypothetical protein EYZ11_007838 [Aspergillus tanneri]|uniref:Uncharacterized protein n=1 Tax=Aspergillus tanneri TaxID=1220188 RepID=A0A4S3JE56_9EURO|nr:hypothetical protein EYZ11_007838 [Aspergillus tanneri]
MAHNRAELIPRDRVDVYITTTLSAAIEELSSPDGRPTIAMSRRPPRTSCYIDPATGALKANEADSRVTYYTWPGKDAYEAWKFTIIFRILAVITEAIHTGLVISKSSRCIVETYIIAIQRASVLRELLIQSSTTWPTPLELTERR